MSESLPSPLKSGKKHLVHVTGLRGLAIVAVCLFHLNKALFPNGYLGVNLFLIITGYFLFSSFLKQSYTFSVSDFCQKKLLRLFPPYLAVIGGVLLISAIIYPNNIIGKFAHYDLTALCGFSNYYFKLRLGNYFSDNADTVPVLMTWYFSVLLQVYVFYGIASLLLRRFSVYLRRAVLIGVAIISLGMTYPPSDWATLFSPGGGGPPADYYSSLCRLWIVLLGAGVSQLPDFRTKTAHVIIPGLSLLTLALMMFCPISFPMQDIPASIAAALCVRYAPTAKLSWSLQNPIFTKIGLVSFSLYLVHWPVLVFARYLLSDGFSCLSYCVVGGLIFILTMVLYLYVERRYFSTLSVLLVWGVLMMISVIFDCTKGLHGVLHPSLRACEPALYTDNRPVPETHPLMQGFPKQYIWKSLPGMGGDLHFWDKPYGLYYLGNEKNNPEYILLGDSHANAIYAGFAAVSQREGWSGVYAALYVLPYTNYQKEIAGCGCWTREKAEAIVSWLAAHPELRTVVISQFWAYHLETGTYSDWDGNMHDNKANPELKYERLRGFVRMLKDAGKTVVILPDAPILPVENFRDEISRNMVLGRPVDRERYAVTKEAYDTQNADINAVFRRLEEEQLITLLHPEDALFRSGSFYALNDDGVLYADYHHIGKIVAEQMVDSISEPFSKILQQAKNEAEDK